VDPSLENTALPSGAVVGVYTVQRLLHRTSDGYTYRVTDPSGLTSTMREFYPHLFALRAETGEVRARDPDDRTPLRFWLRTFLEREAILAKIGSLALPRTLALLEANGTGYLVQSGGDAYSLADLLADRGALAEAPLRRILVNTLAALDAAHSLGILHRRLTPACIALHPQTLAVQLRDFGTLRGPLRLKGHLVTTEGDPGYAAPEELAPTPNPTPAGDLYALAAIALKALTGTTLSANVTERPTNPVSSARAPCSPAFARALDWALDPTASGRPGSAAAWRATLTGGAAEVAAATAAEVPTPRRSNPLLPLAAAAVVVAAGGGWWAAHRPANLTSAATSPSENRVAARENTSSEADQPEAQANAATPQANASGSSIDRLALDLIARERRAQDAQAAQAAAQAAAKTKAAADARSPTPTPAAPQISNPATAPQPAPIRPEPSNPTPAAPRVAAATETPPVPAPSPAPIPPPTPSPRLAEASPPAATPTATVKPAESADARYQSDLRNYLNGIKRYPTGRDASLQRPSGTAEIAFELKRNGSLANAEVIRSSNSTLLDRHALATVRRGNYPPFPEGAFVGEGVHRFIVDLNFAP